MVIIHLNFLQVNLPGSNFTLFILKRFANSIEVEDYIREDSSFDNTSTILYVTVKLKMIISLILLITCVKFLLIPAYHSTDFEVHRNWLAITYSLPVDKWYYENTSEWTLDYPPLFAWFEYILSNIAFYFDSNMLNVNNLNYNSFNTILFQRLSVILTDLVLAYGTYKCMQSLPKNIKNNITLPILLIANIGLLIIDHIHFQYNGIMYGILLLSIALIMKKRYLLGSLAFAILLNMKHIYVYMAPAYFVYLLKNYCINDKKPSFYSKLSIGKLIQLGSIVLGVFLISFGPFYSQLPQVLSRLFPFKRGLCHAYWAPNIWALYNVGDKIMSFVASRLGYEITKSTASMTGGLVKEFSHSVLPNITPKITMILTAIMMTPCLIKLWKLDGKPIHFIRCLILCALTSFIFGWHVHEKAILMAILPLSLAAILDSGDAKVFLILSTVGHYSLFPLLFHNNLILIKTLMMLIYTFFSFYSLPKLYPFQFCKFTLPLLNIFESVYLIGLIPIFLYVNFLHRLIGLDVKLQFLPLMITSVYCSLGVIYCWIKYYVIFLTKT